MSQPFPNPVSSNNPIKPGNPNIVNIQSGMNGGIEPADELNKDFPGVKVGPGQDYVSSIPVIGEGHYNPNQNLNDNNTFCEKHPAKEAISVCSYCNYLLCSDCIIVHKHTSAPYKIIALNNMDNSAFYDNPELENSLKGGRESDQIFSSPNYKNKDSNHIFDSPSSHSKSPLNRMSQDKSPENEKKKDFAIRDQKYNSAVLKSPNQEKFGGRHGDSEYLASSSPHLGVSSKKSRPKKGGSIHNERNQKYEIEDKYPNRIPSSNRKSSQGNLQHKLYNDHYSNEEDSRCIYKFTVDMIPNEQQKILKDAFINTLTKKKPENHSNMNNVPNLDEIIEKSTKNRSSRVSKHTTSSTSVRKENIRDEKRDRQQIDEFRIDDRGSNPRHLDNEKKQKKDSKISNHQTKRARNTHKKPACACCVIF